MASMAPVTQACERVAVTIGSGTPAMVEMVVAHPAVAFNTAPARIRPRFVSTALIRWFSM